MSAADPLQKSSLLADILNKRVQHYGVSTGGQCSTMVGGKDVDESGGTSMHDFSNKAATELALHHPLPLRLREPTGRYFCRLIAAIAACAVNAAPLHAAEIRGDMKGGALLGTRGIVLEGKIEVGDYDKLRSVYGEKWVNQFYLGSPGANQLYLASPGGDLMEAMKIGRLVRSLKLQTIVPSRSGPRLQGVLTAQHKLKNPKANYMCASAWGMSRSMLK